MKPAAQIQAAIELLEEIQSERRPADRMLSAYYRSRRYIGSKDKAAISETIYDVMRQKGSLSWLCNEANLANTPRSWMILHLLSKQVDLDEFFIGDDYSPEVLSEEEAVAQVLASRLLQTNVIQTASEAARLNLPEWLVPLMQKSLGESFVDEMLTMQERARLCIRVNTLKSDRQNLQVVLQGDDIETTSTQYSPWGLMVHQKVSFNHLSSFKEGLFEVQDQGSQLIALVAGVKPGDKVVDFCAGAGGKTLALAAQMENKGVIHACDVHTKRLENLAKRKKRAGVHNIQTHILSSERDKWVKRQSGKMDVVLIDAPCTGTGTWRRSPDARWNLEMENLESLQVLQANILESASRLVKPGGRLIYATCSLLQEENEMQVENFLSNHKSFQSGTLAEQDYLHGLEVKQGYQLSTSPTKTGMDGFFMAVLQRKEQHKEPVKDQGN